MERASFRRTSRGVGTGEAALIGKCIIAATEHERLSNENLLPMLDDVLRHVQLL